MPSDRADRQRRYRRRQARRLAVYRVQGGDELLFALLVSGRMTDEAALNREAVEVELTRIIREWSATWCK